jgi:uncharacterized membrane protein YfcA
MVEWTSGSLLVGLGLAAGLLAGLLGIGGGMVVVPGLFYIFALMNFPESSLMHMAAGTSMCVMVFTAVSSIGSHQVKGDVRWLIVARVVPGILVGVLLGALLDRSLNTRWLEFIFGLFLLVISLKMFLNWRPQTEAGSLPNLAITNLVGLAIGFKSGLLGIGGGAISIPFLIYCGLPMHQVVGTSASFTLPIAILGTILFLNLSQVDGLIPGSTGYIYWPAFWLVAPASILGAVLGTKLCHAISAEKLRRIFAGFLFLLGIKMLLT